MKTTLIALGLFIAVIGIGGSIHLNDPLFAGSFLWCLIYGISALCDDDQTSTKDKQEDDKEDDKDDQ